MENIYAQIITKLPDKVVEALNNLVDAGQIDKDEHGMPIVTNHVKMGAINTLYVVRNEKPEYFIVNTLSKKKPVVSWKDDGYVHGLNPKEMKRRMREE